MKKSVTIIGGGPAGMALATFLDNAYYKVTIFEKNKSLGRKFLVAGKGGFNLTHNNQIQEFIPKYEPSEFIEHALASFDNTDLQKWLEEIGIPTFIGSSGRVFPIKGIKPIAVLQAILDHLKTRGVEIQYQKKWTGWDKENNLVFNNEELVKSDIEVFALGGGSWKVTGSDGTWLELFSQKGIKTIPFQSANCAFEVSWPKEFLQKCAGKPLKNIAITCDGRTEKGEVVITPFGLEGNAIYALTMVIQSHLQHGNDATIYLDLKPSLEKETLNAKMAKSKWKKTSEILKYDFKLYKAKIQLLKSFTTKETFLNPEKLIEKIKSLPIKITAAAPIDEAISTTGGIALKEVNSGFGLDKIPGTYCLGEMLDWYAPTGGYLLQGCFSMGVYLAIKLNEMVKL